MILLILVSCRTVIPYAGRTKSYSASQAAVTCDHPEAADIGAHILKEGGNAFDAAVATHFALAVAYPYAGNIGGGGFMVFREAKGKTGTLDFREKAPAKAQRDMFLDKSGNVIPDRSVYGHLAAGVPGSVDGMVTLHEAKGSLPFPQLIQPAIDLARNGFPITQLQADWFNSKQAKFRELNPDTLAVPLIRHQPWKAGDTLKQEDLARTLERIRDQKRDGFYLGETAELIVKEMEAGQGLISMQDLESFHSTWRNPVVGNYKEYSLISMGPPSSGGIALLQMLGMLESMPLKKWGWGSPQTIHALTEVMRRAYADRATHLGDPDFYAVPVAGLLEESYLQARMADYNPDFATPSSAVTAGNPGQKESSETTHYSIVDAKGNAVSITTTINGPYGSCVFVRGAGFILNNEMDDFSAKPGVANMYGLVGAEANAVQPGKRMLSSMTPTIVEKDHKLFMVLGSPGGSTIITNVMQTFLNVVEFGMGMQQAVAALKIHHQWLPDKIFQEKGTLTPKTVQKLEKMGHKVEERSSIGALNAILVRPDGSLEGAADPRRDCTFRGF